MAGWSLMLADCVRRVRQGSRWGLMARQEIAVRSVKMRDQTVAGVRARARARGRCLEGVVDRGMVRRWRACRNHLVLEELVPALRDLDGTCLLAGEGRECQVCRNCRQGADCTLVAMSDGM